MQAKLVQKKRRTTHVVSRERSRKVHSGGMEERMDSVMQ